MSKLIPLLTLSVLLYLSSCRKVCDFIHDHPDAHDSLCQVTAVGTRTVDGRYVEKYAISYNEKGNPVTMLTTSVFSQSNVYFRYDRFNRLSDLMSVVPGNFGAIFWQKYAYPRPRFITDTVMMYTGDIRDSSSPIAKNSYEYHILGYTLDALDRIVKIWSIPNDPPHTPVLQSEMHYDANGNLPLPDSSLAYDDKVNPYRTNKIWQFLFNDYSRNNRIVTDPLNANRYNDFGLPLTLRNLNLEYLNIFIFGVDTQDPWFELTYACTLPQKQW
jgi:hypothetical protein